FCQAEDGIRGFHVTGVQTCALPIAAGQARRLCLARVLLTGASLIALDEPTEGLGPDAEQAFFRDLPRILHGRSLLLVTHAAVPPNVADATWELVDGRLRKKPVHDAP